MENEKDKWVDSIFSSMEGSQKAKPHPDLLTKIEKGLDEQNTVVASLFPRSYAAAAAILILVVNIFAISQIYQNRNSPLSSVEKEVDSNMSLISNYKIYE